MNEVIQPRNLSHRNFFEDTSRWVISYGGAGSSKSYSTAQKILLDRIMSEEGHRFLIVRKVAKTLRVSVFQLFKDLIVSLDEYDNFKINKSDMTITYVPNGSQLLFFGLDDIEKLKSIQGLTGIWIEEASECEQGDVLELNRRLRGFTPYYKQIILTFNPISHLHWLKAHFFDNVASTASIYKTTYLDNKFIDDEYKQELEEIKNYDVQQYNIYALGEWGVLNTNIVYHNYDYKEHISDKTINDFDVLHVGIDFNIGGCVLVVCGLIALTVHVLEAYAVYDTDSIATELLKLKALGKRITIYPDASGSSRSTNSSRSDIMILMGDNNSHGFTLSAPAANGAVRDRINSVNRKLSKNEILLSPKAQKQSYSLQTQGYKPNGDPEKFDEHKDGAIDDYNDGLGYFIVRMFPIHKQSARVIPKR